MPPPFKPLDDRLVVTVIEEPTTSAGGVVLPSTAQDRPQRGVVVAVSEGAWRGEFFCPPSVVEGDVVLFTRYGGTEVKLEGESYTVLRWADVLGVI